MFIILRSYEIKLIETLKKECSFLKDCKNRVTKILSKVYPTCIKEIL